MLPYFYGSKCRWRKLYQLDDADTQFLEFLQAGMAKVIVPVSVGFEERAMYLLSTGTIWSGDQVPALDSKTYLSVLSEMDDLPPAEGTSEGDPWEVRVPTTLTVLQKDSSGVEGQGLPCDCEDGDNFGAGSSSMVGQEDASEPTE